MALITSADYEFIRKRIDTSLNASSLPDTLIQLFEAEAEEWVTDRVSVEGLSDADSARATRAACYYCAHLIASAWTPMASESIAGAGSSWSKKVIDQLQNSARLLGKAEGELVKLTVDVPTTEDDLQYVTLEFETP